MISSGTLNVEIVSLVDVPGMEETLKNKNRPLVLIVDDEQLIADTLSAILSRNGFRTQAAYEGFTALELARRSRPDLLITDVAMPGMDGVELAVALTDELPKCKVVLFSAHTRASEMVANACEDGYKFQFMAKPIHPELMVKRISEMMATA